MEHHDHDHDIRRHLRALPDPDPPAALRERALASHGRRRRLVHGITGATAVALLFVLAVPGLLPGDAPSGTTVPATAQAPVDMHHANNAIARLRAVDRALQAAYERGASDDELAPLWRARESLLATTLLDRNQS